MSTYHTPVLPKEAIEFLNVKKNHWYIDCNLGGGGHTAKILQSGGKVLGLDMDPDAIKEVSKNYQLELQKEEAGLFAVSENLIIYQTNFTNLKEAVNKFHLDAVSGVLFDLGVSSYQLEQAEKGFSFNLNAPLDMRMDPNSGVSAADLVNGLYEKELAQIFWEWGEERFSRPIAKKIIEARKTKKIETTNELAQIILSVTPRRKPGHIHPATKVFQALRIAVNDELTNLSQTLPQAVDVLQKEGRLVVISFHSLEDRVIKNFFKDLQQKGELEIITKKPVVPSEEEIDINPKSRSSKLRAAYKSSKFSLPNLAN